MTSHAPTSSPRAPSFEPPPALDRAVEVPDFDDFGGRHCETSALRKVLRRQGLVSSEAMLFGLGGGPGFLHWHRKGMPRPFLGSRNGKFPEFVQRIAAHLGVELEVVRTSSPRRAFTDLYRQLAAGTPVVCYGDIYHLPYFQVERHFGGHAFVVFGMDSARDRVLISDRGTSVRVISLGDLARARGSASPPFPPRHAMLEVGVEPGAGISPAALLAAMGECHRAMVQPPIRSFGLSGLSKFGHHLQSAIEQLPACELLESLIGHYVDLELAGTGGSAFRPMYRDFLVEAEGHLEGVHLAPVIERLDAAIAAWQRLIDGLLPPLGISVAAIRKSLQERERLFEQGSTEELTDGRHLRTMEEVFEPAVLEVRAARRALAGLPAKVAAVAEAEHHFFAALGQVVAEHGAGAP